MCDQVESFLFVHLNRGYLARKQNTDCNDAKLKYILEFGTIEKHHDSIYPDSTNEKLEEPNHIMKSAVVLDGRGRKKGQKEVIERMVPLCSKLVDSVT